MPLRGTYKGGDLGWELGALDGEHWKEEGDRKDYWRGFPDTGTWQSENMHRLITVDALHLRNA